MKLQDVMKDFLDQTPGLDLVAYGDLSSGLILNSASKVACPRERLDLLGEKAAICFGLAPKGAGVVGNSWALHFSERETQVFARQPETSDEVICAVCQPGTALQPLLIAAIDLAGRMAGPE